MEEAVGREEEVEKGREHEESEKWKTRNIYRERKRRKSRELTKV